MTLGGVRFKMHIMKPSVRAGIIWLTGPPASGKTSIAGRLIEALRRRGIVTLWLDSDELRTVLTPSPTYDASERDWFYRAIGHLALLGERGGSVVVVSATASKQSYRDFVRERAESFTEVLVDCPLELRKARDAKQLYARAAAKEISTLPGDGVAYEAPAHPELVLNSTSKSPEELADQIVGAIFDQGVAR
jgi:adenylylsulfate kinase